MFAASYITFELTVGDSWTITDTLLALVGEPAMIGAPSSSSPVSSRAARPAPLPPPAGREPRRLLGATDGETAEPGPRNRRPR